MSQLQHRVACTYVHSYLLIKGKRYDLQSHNSWGIKTTIYIDTTFKRVFAEGISKIYNSLVDKSLKCVSLNCYFYYFFGTQLSELGT